MKKRLALLLFAVGLTVATAQTSKYEVFGSVGPAYERNPYITKSWISTGFGYKITPNYTTYTSYTYTWNGSQHFRAGMKRTFRKHGQPLGVVTSVDGGFSRRTSGVVKPSGSVGLGLCYSLPHRFGVSFVPKLTKVSSVTSYVSLAVGFSKSF